FFIIAFNLKDREEKTSFFYIAVSYPVMTHALGPSYFKPVDIIAVMNNAHCICLFIRDAIICLMPICCQNNNLLFFNCTLHKFYDFNDIIKYCVYYMRIF